MGENLCAQDIPGLQTGEDTLPVKLGTVSDLEGAKKTKGRKRSRKSAGQANRKGEMISPLTPLTLTELPQDFDFIASKTDDEKIEFIQSVLESFHSESRVRSRRNVRMLERRAATRITSGASSGGKSKLGRIYSSLESRLGSRLTFRQGDYATE